MVNRSLPDSIQFSQSFQLIRTFHLAESYKPPCMFIPSAGNGATIVNTAANMGAAMGLMASLALIAPAEAAGNERDFAKTYGKALPPIGFVDYCKRNPADCRPLRAEEARLAMTPDRWQTVQEINIYVNEKIVPVSDNDLYGKAEYWTVPTDAGDCEDFLLLKKKYLEALGFPAEALLITVVLDEKNEGHAVLTVAADTGDFVLDNRRDEIMRWSDTGYRFLKRQSAQNPQSWVALTRPTAKTNGISSGGTRTEE